MDFYTHISMFHILADLVTSMVPRAVLKIINFDTPTAMLRTVSDLNKPIVSRGNTRPWPHHSEWPEMSTACQHLKIIKIDTHIIIFGTRIWPTLVVPRSNSGMYQDAREIIKMIVFGNNIRNLEVWYPYYWSCTNFIPCPLVTGSRGNMSKSQSTGSVTMVSFQVVGIYGKH